MIHIKKQKSAMFPYMMNAIISVVAIVRLYRNGDLLLAKIMVLLLLLSLVSVSLVVFYGYIFVDTDNRMISVRRFFQRDKFSIDDLDGIILATSAFKLSKFAIKNSKNITFDAEYLSNDDIAFLQSLAKGRDKI